MQFKNQGLAYRAYTKATQFSKRNVPFHHWLRKAYNNIRQPMWEAEVLGWREKCREMARAKGIHYSEEHSRATCQSSVRKKGILAKEKGQLRILTCMGNATENTWLGDHLLPPLSEYGDHKSIHILPDWNKLGPWVKNERDKENERLMGELIKWHEEKPIDLFFYYGGEFQLAPETLNKINDLGIATLSLGTDDLSSLKSGKIEGVSRGLSGTAGLFDLNFTTSSQTCDEYLLYGGTPYFLPLAANQKIYKRLDIKRDIPVAQFGSRLPHREALVSQLSKRGVQVQCFGSGWPSEYAGSLKHGGSDTWDSGFVSTENIVELMNRSQIVLSHQGHDPWLNKVESKVTCVRMREFEVPMTGGLLITCFCPDLQKYYNIGKEILCYRSSGDLYDTILYLQHNPHKMEAIREAGWKRASREHTWERRYDQLFSVMGILQL